MLKLGSKGAEVSEVQKLLSLLGYDLVADGSFGPKTQRSVKSFQKKMGLTDDGIVGPKTLQALKAYQKRTSKEIKTTIEPKDIVGAPQINKTKQLHPNQYIKQVFPKSQLFIHFTAGGPSAANTISGWNSDEPRIATAYVINGRTSGDDGEIFECFNPDLWGFHLGIKNTNGKLDKISIGIEICAWGPLKEKDDKFYHYLNREVSADEVYTLDNPHKGFKLYHAYSEGQLKSLEALLCSLIEHYKIPVQSSFDSTWFDFDASVIKNATPGIWTHTTVRKDKFDSYPDARLLDMLNRISAKYNS
jgi:N-acetyl-anhydromuramyl-L-alanine amidase AmpD